MTELLVPLVIVVIKEARGLQVLKGQQAPQALTGSRALQVPLVLLE